MAHPVEVFWLKMNEGSGTPADAKSVLSLSVKGTISWTTGGRVWTDVPDIEGYTNDEAYYDDDGSYFRSSFGDDTEGVLMWWQKITDDADDQGWFSFGSSTSGDTNLWIENDMSVGEKFIQAQLKVDGTVQWRMDTPTDSISGGTWIHVAFKHNGTRAVCWINAVKQTTNWVTSTDKTAWMDALTDSGNTTKANRIAFGTNWNGSEWAKGTDGLFQDIRYFSDGSDIGGEEIRAIYNGGRGTTLSLHDAMMCPGVNLATIF